MRRGFPPQEPPCPLDRHRFKGCLVLRDGELIYYVNRRAKADALWTFWNAGVTYPAGEDPSLCNDYYPALATPETWVPYSETVVLEDNDAEQRDAVYPDGYRDQVSTPFCRRLDFYATRSEFAEAYRAISRLGRTYRGERVTEARIFRHVRVELLDDNAFGELVEDPFGKPWAEGA